MTEKWTTRDEIKFIDGLGTYTMSTVLTMKGRAELLCKYIDSISIRSKWGDIDPDAVREHAAARLKLFFVAANQ